MAFFYSKACQTEKAFRALFCLQGKGNWENSFVSNDSRERIIPNRTFVASAFTPTRPYRPEGMVFLEIQHHFPAVIQPNEKNTLGQVDWNAQQRLIDEFLGETFDTLNLGGTNVQDMSPLADAVTKAGRWLAVPDGTPAGDQIAADNAEMVNFRCDWVKFGSPALTRGNEKGGTNWIEIVHIVAQVSHASTSN